MTKFPSGIKAFLASYQLTKHSILLTSIAKTTSHVADNGVSLAPTHSPIKFQYLHKKINETIWTIVCTLHAILHITNIALFELTVFSSV